MNSSEGIDFSLYIITEIRISRMKEGTVLPVSFPESRLRSLMATFPKTRSSVHSSPGYLFRQSSESVFPRGGVRFCIYCKLSGDTDDRRGVVQGSEFQQLNFRIHSLKLFYFPQIFNEHVLHARLLSHL